MHAIDVAGILLGLWSKFQTKSSRVEYAHKMYKQQMQNDLQNEKHNREKGYELELIIMRIYARLRIDFEMRAHVNVLKRVISIMVLHVRTSFHRFFFMPTSSNVTFVPIALLSVSHSRAWNEKLISSIPTKTRIEKSQFMLRSKSQDDQIDI